MMTVEGHHVQVRLVPFGQACISATISQAEQQPNARDEKEEPARLIEGTTALTRFLAAPEPTLTR